MDNKGNTLLIIIVILALAVASYFIFFDKNESPAPEAEEGVLTQEEGSAPMPEGAIMPARLDKQSVSGGEDGTKPASWETNGSNPNIAHMPGSYRNYEPDLLSLAQYDGSVVLFFYASWCPYCRTADSDISQNIFQIPDNVHILKVNYDSETALKQKYGVTYQHTFVQVDSAGNLIKKWSGSETLANILKNIGKL